MIQNLVICYLKFVVLVLIIPYQSKCIHAISQDESSDENTADPDIVILHPPDGALVEPERLIVAFHVSAFAIVRLGPSLVGVRLLINGYIGMESGLVIHGNDGTAQYHVEMQDLAPAVYELRAQLVLREEAPSPGNQLQLADAVAVIEVLAKSAAEDEERAQASRTAPDLLPSFLDCQSPPPPPRCTTPAHPANDTTCAASSAAAAAPPCGGCSGHGKCAPADAAGGCRCRPDWFGPTCEHSTFTAAT
jgi:hypothetical protein